MAHSRAHMAHSNYWAALAAEGKTKEHHGQYVHQPFWWLSWSVATMTVNTVSINAKQGPSHPQPSWGPLRQRSGCHGCCLKTWPWGLWRCPGGHRRPVSSGCRSADYYSRPVTSWGLMKAMWVQSNPPKILGKLQNVMNPSLMGTSSPSSVGKYTWSWRWVNMASRKLCGQWIAKDWGTLRTSVTATWKDPVSRNLRENRIFCKMGVAQLVFFPPHTTYPLLLSHSLITACCSFLSGDGNG